MNDSYYVLVAVEGFLRVHFPHSKQEETDSTSFLELTKIPENIDLILIFFFNLQPFTKGISNLKTVSLDLKTHRWQSWIVIVVLHILPSLCF